MYELLKDAIKITRRSVRKANYDLHGRTSLVGEAPDAIHARFEDAEAELQDVMIVSMFASFERELRTAIQAAFLTNTQSSKDTMLRLVNLTCDSIERWTVKDIIDAFSNEVDDELRGHVKQIYEYRNWIAHGRNPKRQPAARADARTVATKLTSFLEQTKDSF
jgi:hypothetical protein